MKIKIINKEGDLKVTCDSANIKDGMLILVNPILESGVKSVEVWIPVSTLSLIEIIEKNEEKIVSV